MAQDPSSTRRRSHIWLKLAIPLFLLGGITWLWQKGYNMEQVLLKIQSLVVSIHIAPQAENMVPIPRGKYQQGDVEELGEAWRNPVRRVGLSFWPFGDFFLF